MVEHLSTTLAEKLAMSGTAIFISVDVVADPICVKSYLCHRQIERSLDQIRLKGFPIVAKIRHYPYLLDPLLAEDSSISLRELIELNYGDTSNAFIGETEELGIDCGINFAFDAPLRQSIDVHRILMYAELRFGLAAQYHLLQHFYKYYFENSIDIFERASLANIVCSPILDPDNQDRRLFPDAQIARLWLESDVLREEVMDLAGKARLKGIKGTPFVVFNKKYAVCGAQGEEKFIQILSDIVGRKK